MRLSFFILNKHTDVEIKKNINKQKSILFQLPSFIKKTKYLDLFRMTY
jgi:hypothetical protein